ncbi:MAG: AAA family ATPase [Inquilinus sp.]|uniref:ATP-binding protein n=1 Tax=Inquilinus sp. TaxID=1932117 RepID=UPI003F33606A
MRLLRLDLDRYGPFTGRTLSFRPGARLHVVHGPNEAGKSCALAAITDLLFGIERLTRYDFQHEGKDLRIGAEIIGRDGGRLAFRRRKGNKNTLLAPDDSPIADDALLPYLGSLTRDVFCRAFGLNAETLRRGAEDMLRSDGEAGASLFAAASGLRGLSDLRRSLDDEASTIFAPRASKDRRFYQALDRFEDARKSIRERELRAGDWKALNESIGSLATRLAEIKAQRAEIAAARSQLLRLKRVGPLMRLLDEHLVRLDAFADLPQLSRGGADALRDSLDAVTQAEERLRRAQADQATAQQELDGIVVDEALTGAADQVVQIFGESGGHAASRRDLPRIQAELDDLEQTLAALAGRLGQEPGAVQTVQPSDAAQAQLQRLIADGRALAETRRGQHAAIERETATLAELQRQQAEQGGLSDPRPLQQRLGAIEPVLQQLDRRAEIDREIRTEHRSLGEAAARLMPPVTDLDAIASAPHPGTEAIGRHRSLQDELAAQERRERDQIAAAAATASSIEAKIEALSTSRPVPSVERIAALRLDRDREWERLRGTLFGESGAPQGGALASTVARFERLTAEADQLSDDAQADAARVGEHAVETRNLVLVRQQAEAAQDRLAVLETRRREAAEDWQGLWTGLAVTPGTPAEMTGWLTAVEALLQRRDAVEAQRDRVAAIDRMVRDVVPTLQAIAAESGLPALDPLEPGLVANRLRQHLAELANGWDKARGLAARIDDGRRRIEALRAAEVETAAGLEAWTALWAEAAPGIGQALSTSIDGAEAALAVWREVPAALRERDNRARRVAGLHRDIATFERRAVDLISRLAPDLAALPADAAVTILHERVAAARDAASRRAVAIEHLARTDRAGVDARRTLAEAERTRDELAAELPSGLDLGIVLARWTERDGLATAIADQRTQLVLQSDGLDEVSLRASLAEFDADTAEARLQGLAQEDDGLDHAAQETFAEQDRALRRRAELEQGVGAEVAAQQRRNAETELVETAREWAVRKIGALMIGAAVERHRASQEDPLLARAGGLFAMLTGGAYDGVVQEFDDGDTPRLVGRRPDGRTIPIQGMSEGTRDQLYLALRLAYLDAYANRAEPAPFVVDDIFASFDEARTAHGLKALAAIADRVQMVVFTHHQHVADAAARELGDEAAVISLG